MPKLTLLSRISDGLPLAASMEDEKDHRELDVHKEAAKKLVKGIRPNAPEKNMVEVCFAKHSRVKDDAAPRHKRRGEKWRESGQGPIFRVAHAPC